MLDADQIEEIIATYRKYGWMLRRVLLTMQMKSVTQDRASTLFGDASIRESGIDAAWFSRPPMSGGVSWELRYLGDIPFAILEKVDEQDPEFENVLRNVESRLRDAIAAKNEA
jgi:hypothetical protein